MELIKFEMGDELYGLDIKYIDEIVESKEVTKIPNSSEEIEGVMDLRGQTTSIINLKYMFDIDSENIGNYIIILNTDSKGFRVDNVNNIVEVESEDINKEISKDENMIEGVINIEDEFVVLIEPKNYINKRV